MYATFRENGKAHQVAAEAIRLVPDGGRLARVNSQRPLNWGREDKIQALRQLQIMRGMRAVFVMAWDGGEYTLHTYGSRS